MTEGYKFVVDMDLEKYFDTVNQSKLIQILSETIKDRRVISLIHKFLNAGVEIGGMFEESREGLPQGGPASSLPGNIMLDEWMRSRIRMVTWKRWKKVKTRFAYLKRLGLDEERAWMWANTRKGYWRTAHSPILSRTLSNQRLKQAGYLNFYDYYLQVNV